MRMDGRFMFGCCLFGVNDLLWLVVAQRQLGQPDGCAHEGVVGLGQVVVGHDVGPVAPPAIVAERQGCEGFSVDERVGVDGAHDAQPGGVGLGDPWVVGAEACQLVAGEGLWGGDGCGAMEQGDGVGGGGDGVGLALERLVELCVAGPGGVGPDDIEHVAYPTCHYDEHEHAPEAPSEEPVEGCCRSGGVGDWRLGRGVGDGRVAGAGCLGDVSDGVGGGLVVVEQRVGHQPVLPCRFGCQRGGIGGCGPVDRGGLEAGEGLVDDVAHGRVGGEGDFLMASDKDSFTGVDIDAFAGFHHDELECAKSLDLDVFVAWQHFGYQLEAFGGEGIVGGEG